MPIFQLGMPMCQTVSLFQLDVPTFQRACQFFRNSSYEILREISILNYCIKNSLLYLISYLYISCVYVSYIKIVLYFISILHSILKKSVCNFCFFKLFCSLVRNENIKRPGFYTLKARMKSNKDFL